MLMYESYHPGYTHQLFADLAKEFSVNAFEAGKILNLLAIISNEVGIAAS